MPDQDFCARVHRAEHVTARAVEKAWNLSQSGALSAFATARRAEDEVSAKRPEKIVAPRGSDAEWAPS
jgi:hypothetical protein